MTTRGVRRLKEYLADGEEVARMSATRRIAAMAPLLSAKLRRQSTTTHKSNTRQRQQPQQNEVKDTVKTRNTTTTVVPTMPVSEAVVTYLRQHHDCGASNKLSHTQLRLVDILAGNNNLQTTTNTVGGESDASTNAKSGGNGMESGGVVRVRRVHLPSVRAIVDSLAIAGLERHHRYSLSGTTTTAVNAGLMEGGVLFVLAEDAALAEELRRELVTRYALNVMLLGDHDVPRFPSWPTVTTAANNNNSGNESERSSVATATKKATRSATAASRKRARSTRRGGNNNEEEEEGTKQGKSNSADDDNSNRVAVAATTPSAAQDSHTSSGSGDAASGAASVVIATAAGFLAVDRRSAVWKFIGAYTIVLRTASPRESSLLQQLHIKRTSNKNSESTSLSGDAVSQSTAAMSMAARLAAQRWACLGHCPLACVIATHRAMLVEPALDWLLTLQPISSSSSKSGAVQGRDVAAVAQSQTIKDGTHEQPAEGTVKKKKKKSETIVPVMREPVTLYHATAEGIERFQFLFGLICGLAPHRGLLVHCASKACCVFLRHALYALADELPPHVRVLYDVDDEEGAREGGEILSEAAKRELCATFDATVLATTNNNSEKGGEAAVTKTSAVLLSCCGLVPREGDIFLQYDLLLDLPSFTQFVSDVLTPGAYRDQTLCAPARQSKTDSTNGSNDDEDALLVRRVTQTRSRKRSTSPIPFTASASSSTAGHKARATSPTPRQDNTTSQQQQRIAEVSRTPRTATKYSIILLLFRPCELPKALHCLALTTARHALRLAPLPQPPSRLRYAHIASKLRSLHRQTFEFARLSYEAYKATMALYASMRGSGVYDCTKVNLQKVAEEYGYVNTVPVLDLRLRDTVFRPKEDYYKAARQKQAHESSAYRRFAAERIAPEPTEAHVVDEIHTTHKPVRRRRRRHY